jgi:hypothetical protein
MADTHITVANQARAAVVETLLKRPKTAYIEYGANTKKVAEEGDWYIFNGEEELTYKDEDSHNDRDKWTGTVTVVYKVGFDIEKH